MEDTKHGLELIRVLDKKLGPLHGSYSIPDIHGAEIGVRYGGTSRTLLKHMPTLRLWMIDMWLADPEYPYTASNEEGMKYMADAERNTNEFSARRTMIIGKSTAAGRIFKPGCLDFVFIDANHGFKHVCEDILTWWPKIRKGGVLCGHDYGDEMWEVQQAVDQFVLDNHLPYPVETGKETLWFINK